MTHTARRALRSIMAWPSATVGCPMVNEVRNTLGRQALRVTACTPALGMMLSVPLSATTFWIAICTPECTVPTITSTLSCATRRRALASAFFGSDSSSSLIHSTSRPARRPPFSATAMRMPFSMASPSLA